MKITPIKTDVLTARAMDVTEVLEKFLPRVPENSVVAVTSKIVSLCEGSVEAGGRDKGALIEREADLYLPASENKYGVYITIKNGLLIPSAGIDESNSDGDLVLWPRDPQASAVRCRDFIRERFGLENVGVVLTDSTTSPLRWGVRGIAVAHCGFEAVNSRIGSPDLFGRALHATRVNVADALAASAVLCMGEAAEQTPLALLEDLPFVRFRGDAPTGEELRRAIVAPGDDLFGSFWAALPWRKGKGGSRL